MWDYLGVILEVFWEDFEGKTIHKKEHKLSTNFLIETPKRVLPRDSHYFLLAPINPFKGAFRGYFEDNFDGKPNKQQTEPKNNSKNFLLIF